MGYRALAGHPLEIIAAWYHWNSTVFADQDRSRVIFPSSGKTLRPQAVDRSVGGRGRRGEAFVLGRGCLGLFIRVTFGPTISHAVVTEHRNGHQNGPEQQQPPWEHGRGRELSRGGGGGGNTLWNVARFAPFPPGSYHRQTPCQIFII